MSTSQVSGFTGIQKLLLTFALLIVLTPFVLMLMYTFAPATVQGSVEPVRKPSNEPILINVKPLPVFVEQVMTTCHSKLSSAKQQILAKQIARVAEATFEQRAEQEAFTFLVCIESGFNGNAKSPVGALGLTQVMPKYASSFAQECGLGDVSEADLLDAEVSLTVGACQFRHLLESWNNNVALALSSYNSGEFSPSTKRLSQLKTSNAETDSYVARYLVLREAHK